ncbi:MAG: serine hydrolase domain-containing protein [Pirellulaceae bacterium]
MPRFFLVSLCLAITSPINVLGQNIQTTAPAAASNQSVTSEALEGLGRAVEHYIGKDYAVGAELLVLHKGQTLYHESFGYSDREDKRRWQNNTLCNIRSMTKPITSAAAQILIDRNLLHLDDPVAKYLKSFDNDESKSITVRQVLTHRSGLPLTNLTKPDQYSSLTDQVAAGGGKGPEFEPGSKFWYSDLGTDVVGALVEKVSGEPLHDFVKRELLDPLGMSSSLYGIDADDKRLSQAASLYLKVPTGWLPFWKGDSKPFYPFAWGSQTIYSTTTDYAKFLRMMMNGGRVGDRQLLSAAAVSRMLAPVSRAKMMQSDTLAPTEFRNLEVYYGQMMVTYRVIGKEKEKPVVIGHSGSDGTCAWAWPERDLIILYFTQSRGGMTPLRIEEPIDRLIIHQGQKYTEEAPPRLRPYLGTFIANYDTFDNEEFVVKVKNGKLVLDVPSQMAFELLEPDEKGYWAFAIVPDKVKATFDRNENNEVVGLKLHRTGQVYEVPRKGTARAKELSKRTSDPDAQAITWVGTLDAQGNKLRLKINIFERAGKLTGKLVSLDQGNFTTLVSDIIVKGDKLSFSIPGAGATFSGKYAKDGAIAEGTFTQGGVKMPLTLSRSAAKETPQGTLKEAWIGKLSVGLVNPVMQFRIVTLKSGETQAYFDSVTEGRTGFKATWSVDGDKLKFDVAAIKLQYRGTLNKAGDTAEGTWSQGGREVPLTLKKHATEYGK